MNNKVKTVLIVLLIAAIILLGIFWYLMRQTKINNSMEKENNLIQSEIEKQNQINQQEEVNNEQPQNNFQIQADKEKIDKYIQSISAEEKLKAQLQKIAIAFVERHGSYSNQSNYENLEDLLLFMTNDLKNETQAFISVRRKQDRDSSIYYGMVSKVLDVKTDSFSPEVGFVSFNVATQRQEMTGSNVNSNIFYQNVEVEFEKEAGVWKVNKISWL